MEKQDKTTFMGSPWTICTVFSTVAPAKLTKHSNLIKCWKHWLWPGLQEEYYEQCEGVVGDPVSWIIVGNPIQPCPVSHEEHQRAHPRVQVAKYVQHF